MRSHWKWSVRISPVRPEDMMASNLMTMPRVQDACYHVAHHDNGDGQLELCAQSTNDTILAMLRVLRTPFVNRTLTIEIAKRSFVKVDKVAKESGKDDSSSTANATMSETKPVQESVEGGTETEMSMEEDKAGKDEGEKEDVKIEEDKRNEEEMEEDDEEREHAGDKSGPGSGGRSIVYGDVKETAAFVINLNRIQRVNIKSARRLKGDLFRRSVYVGCLPKRTTEELMKVIFPVANSIIMKPAEDPNMRHLFLETTNHANCVGFVTSYLGLKINDQEIKLSIRVQDLSMLKVEEKEKKDKKKEGEEAEETKDKEVEDKVDKEEEETKIEEMKSATENGEEKEEKTEESEKAEESEKTEELEKPEDSEKTEEDNTEESKKKEKKKPEGKGIVKELSEEEKRTRAQLNRQKKKRKREFMEEVHREWSAKKPRQDQGGPMSSPPGMGPRFPFGPPRGRGTFASRGGGMAGPMTPPLFQIQDKVSSLLRLQNQLEKTISTQMEFIQQSEVAARQQAEQRLRDMVMMSQEIAFEEAMGGMGKGSAMRGRGGFQRGGSPQGGKFSGIAGRNFGGKGGKQRDFHRSPSFGDGTSESQAQGGGFAKRFRKDSDSRYETRGEFGDSFKGGKNFQGGNQGNAFHGQKKFGGFGGGDDYSSGNQFDDSSFGSGGNFRGGKNKFGRGGKFGGGNQMEGGKFGGGNQMGGGKYGGKGSQRGGGKFGAGKKFGGGNFGGSGNQMGGNDFGGSGNKFSAGGSKARGGKKFGGGANQARNVSSFSGSGMNMGGGYGSSSSSWGTGTGSQSYGGAGNYESNFGSDMSSGIYTSTSGSGSYGGFSPGDMMGMGSTSSYSSAGGFNMGTGYSAGGQNWKYGQNQW